MAQLECGALTETWTMVSLMARETFASLACAAIVSLTIFILSLALTA